MSRIGAASQSRPTSALQALSGHSDVVLGVSAHPTKLMIASSGTDKDLKCIRIWEHVPRPPEPASAPEAATGAPAAEGEAAPAVEAAANGAAEPAPASAA